MVTELGSTNQPQEMYSCFFNGNPHKIQVNAILKLYLKDFPHFTRNSSFIGFARRLARQWLTPLKSVSAQQEWERVNANLFFSGRIFSGIEIHVLRPMITEDRFEPSPVVILKTNNLKN